MKQSQKRAWLLAVWSVFFSVLMSSCAQLSPQQIVIKPEIEVMPKMASKGVVKIRIEDDRPSPVLGHRGGVYAKSSVIELESGFEGILLAEVAEQFKQAGIRVSDSQADTQVSIILDR